jgi:MYXO-CTERM domain-containing protein
MSAMPEHRNPGQDAAHDVLAAEAFAMPSADPSLRHGPITLPDDPSGIAEPHDVLAAEEFAMPAARGRSEGSGGGPLALATQAASPKRVGIAAAVALVALLVLRRRRGR